VAAFDRLYRRKLAHLYHLLKLPAPADLDAPVSLGSRQQEPTVAMRRAS
jgi:hypothetical protein